MMGYEFTPRIRQIREFFSLSQTDFARQLGISSKKLIEYEKGDSIPHSFFEKLNEKFSVNYDWFFEGKGEPFYKDDIEPLKLTLSDYSQRIKMIRESLTLKISDFSRQLNVPRSTLVGWEEGKTVSIDILKKLEKLFNVNIDWFLTGDGKMFLTSPKSVINNESPTDNYGMNTSYVESNTLSVNLREGKIPIFSQRVSCGPGQEWLSDENIEKYVDVTDLFPLVGKRKDIIGFPVRGGSMEGAGIMDGDIVIVRPIGSDFLGSNYYLYAYDDSVYLKYIVESDDSYITYSLLPDGEQRKIHEIRFDDEYQRMNILGIVVAWIHENKLIRR